MSMKRRIIARLLEADHEGSRKFISINGEGQRAGELAVFIRFQGCNLRCSYCDTAWAYERSVRTKI